MRRASNRLLAGQVLQGVVNRCRLFRCPEISIGSIREFDSGAAFLVAWLTFSPL
jgi:hypothetical protein